MNYKTNYISHNNVYKKLKKDRARGWNIDEEDEVKMKQQLSKNLNLINLNEKAIGLDLGCGAGNITIWLENLGYNMYGIDISPIAVEWAKEKNKTIKFEEGNVVELKNYPDNYFDFIVDSHCFHCIIGDDRGKMLDNIKRILKKDGYLLILTMCQPFNIIKNFDKSTNCIVRNGISLRYIGKPENIINEVKKSGLEIVSSFIEDDQDNPNDLNILAKKIEI